MNNDRFLLEFTEYGNIMVNDADRPIYLEYMQAKTVFDAVVAGCTLIADQKLELNAYYSVR